MDSSQHVEDFQIGEGSSQAMDEVSSHTIIQVEADSSQHDKDATPPPTAIQKGDSSCPHANDSTPPKTDVHRNLQELVDKLEDSSNFWYKKRSLMKKIDDNGMCPIHLAAMEGHPEIIKKFMQLMPNCVDIRSKERETALHIAVKYDQLEVVKILLEEGKNIGENNGQLKAVKMLLKEARNVRKMVSHDCDKDGNTALHLAVNKADTQIVRELLKLPGVSVNAENRDGLTALDIAVHSTVLCQDDRHSNCEEIKTILEAVGGCGRYSRHSQGKENKIVDVDTVVASLIATITFAAIFQIPGGIEDDPKALLYGGAKKLSNLAFLWFSIFNTVALFTSLTVVMAWLHRQRFRTEPFYKYRSVMADVSGLLLETSIVCTGLAFLCAYMLIVTPNDFTYKKYTPEYNLLIWSMIGAACFAPAIWWTRFLGMLISKFYTSLTQTPNPGLFPKSVLCTWFVVGLVIALSVVGSVFFR